MEQTHRIPYWEFQHVHAISMTAPAYPIARVEVRLSNNNEAFETKVRVRYAVAVIAKDVSIYKAIGDNRPPLPENLAEPGPWSLLTRKCIIEPVSGSDDGYGDELMTQSDLEKYIDLYSAIVVLDEPNPDIQKKRIALVTDDLKAEAKEQWEWARYYEQQQQQQQNADA